MSRLRWTCLAVLLAALAGALSPSVVRAQLADHLASLFDDQNARAYVEPLRQSLAAGLGSGLAPTGRVAKNGTWHARMGLQTMWISLQDDDRSFRAQLPEGFPATGSVLAPTVIGDAGGATYSAAGADSFTSIRFPGGFDLDRLAFAVPQFTVGVRGFEATVRWASVERGSSELANFDLFGLSGRYDVTTLLGRDLPVDIAASAAYQDLEYGDGLIEAKMLSFGVHVSRTFGRIVPYSALSFDSFDFDVAFEDADGARSVLAFDREQRPRITLGTALHLPFLHLSGELGFSEQFSSSLGLSVGP